MNKEGEIIVIEDDNDDQEMFTEIFKKSNVTNKIKFFNTGDDALEYLENVNTEPFLIMSDINLPKLNGFELRERIFTNKELSKKCIPYIFFTTAVNKESVIKAYSISAQGFFIKPTTFAELEEAILSILSYWKKCYSPSDFQ